MANGVVAACHVRCYDRNQLIILPEHRLEALKHHGEAMVIQGSSFRTKVEPPDESSLSRHHFAQTALAASVRAVRHLPETLLEHQQPPLRFPSRLRVRPTLRKPRSRSGDQQSASCRGQISGWKARATFIRVHSCPFVVQRHPCVSFASSRLRVRPTAWKTPSPQRQSAGSQLQRADLGLESPSCV